MDSMTAITILSYLLIGIASTNFILNLDNHLLYERMSKMVKQLFAFSLIWTAIILFEFLTGFMHFVGIIPTYHIAFTIPSFLIGFLIILNLLILFISVQHGIRPTLNSSIKYLQLMIYIWVIWLFFERAPYIRLLMLGSSAFLVAMTGYLTMKMSQYLKMSRYVVDYINIGKGTGIFYVFSIIEGVAGISVHYNYKIGYYFGVVRLIVAIASIAVILRELGNVGVRRLY